MQGSKLPSCALFEAATDALSMSSSTMIVVAQHRCSSCAKAKSKGIELEPLFIIDLQDL
jgi:hypothetical protein